MGIKNLNKYVHTCALPYTMPFHSMSFHNLSSHFVPFQIQNYPIFYNFILYIGRFQALDFYSPFITITLFRLISPQILFSQGPSIKYVRTFSVNFDTILSHVSNHQHFSTPSPKSMSAFAPTPYKTHVLFKKAVTAMFKKQFLCWVIVGCQCAEPYLAFQIRGCSQ